MILQPLTVNSFWSDTNGDGIKEWVEDPPAGDSWWDQDTTSTLDAQGVRQYNGDLVTETRYNSMNLAIKEIDARGVVTSHTYDLLGRRTRTVANDTASLTAPSRTISMAYQVTGINGGKEAGASLFDISGFKPVQITDAGGGITKITYDALYRPVKVQRPDDNYIHTTYNKVGNVTSTCDPTTNPAPATETDTEGNLRLFQAAAAPTVYVTQTQYDVSGQPVNVVYADKKTVTSAYTFFGKPYLSKDETGLYTHARYNAAGLPCKTIVSALATADENQDLSLADPATLTNYDAVGNPVSVRDPLGNVTETRYDARNRPFKTIFPAVVDTLAAGATPVTKRPVTVTAYDRLGRTVATTDPLGRTSRHFYDAAGRLVASFDALDQATYTAHDASGNVISMINPLRKEVTNEYDAFGQLVKTTDAAGISNQFGYDAAGNRTSVKDGLNQETKFEYDKLNRLISKTLPQPLTPNVWTYTYNAVDMISQKDPKAAVTSYTYDVRHRLELAGTRDLFYDVTTGRLTKVTEMGITNDKTVEYSYDAFGHQITEKSVGIKHTSTYDKAGKRTKIIYADGRTVSTTYDALNRPAVLRDDNGTASVLTDDLTTQYGYDLAGRAVQLIAPNGQVSRNTYDELGRLTARTLYRSISQMTEAGRVASFTWLHDKLGNVTSQTEYWFASGTLAARERTTAMTYDGANRLITEIITEPSLAQVTTTYSYDAGNNRTTKAVTLGAGTAPANTETGHWTYTYNSANQLTKLEKRASADAAILATTTYTYDANGNRISKVESVPATSTVTNRTTTYTWDVFDRLATVAHPVLKYTARQTYTYTYDYRTRRTGIARAAVTGGLAANHTAVVFSGGLSVADYERPTNTVLTGVSPTTTPTVPTLEYSRGPDMGGGVGGLLGTLRNPLNTSKVPVNPTTTLPATIRYNLSNGRGDIVAQSDSAGALTWTASYEAYGKRTKETGTNADKQRANTKDEDPTGLLNEGFRYRDIETGVWLSRDPAGFVDGPNLYAYVMQNPWTMFDPEGLTSADIAANQLLAQQIAAQTGQSFSQANTQVQNMNGSAAVPALIAGGVVLSATTVYSALPYLITPVGVAAATDAVITTSEAVSGIEGPGPVTSAGDLIKMPLQKLSKDVGGETAKSLVRKSDEIIEKLFRGVPGNGTEKAELAKRGIVKPRGTATDPGTLRKHVLAEDVASGVTSWTPDRDVAKRFAGPQGTIVEVPKIQVKDKIVPRPQVQKHAAEKEILVKGVVQGKPTKP